MKNLIGTKVVLEIAQTSPRLSAYAVSGSNRTSPVLFSKDDNQLSNGSYHCSSHCQR